MAERVQPASFSAEALLYLLRFAAADPSAPPHLRPQLRALARCYAAKYSACADAAAERRFAAFLRGGFFAAAEREIFRALLKR